MSNDEVDDEEFIRTHYITSAQTHANAQQQTQTKITLQSRWKALPFFQKICLIFAVIVFLLNIVVFSALLSVKLLYVNTSVITPPAPSREKTNQRIKPTKVPVQHHVIPPVNTPTPTIVPTPIYQAPPSPYVPPTQNIVPVPTKAPAPTPTAVPTKAPTPTPTPILTPTPSPTQIQPTPTDTPVPTPTSIPAPFPTISQ